MREDRRAQVWYARELLRRGRYGEFARRAASAARVELTRLLGRSEEQAYRKWLAERERDLTARWAPKEGPLVSLLLPAGAPGRMTFSVESLLRQSYRKWEVVAGRASRFPSDERVRVVAGGLPELYRAARGEVIGIVLPGDSLLPRALERTLAALLARPEAPLVYTDEGLLDAGGSALRPRFKPDWSPELALNLPYTGQLTLVRRAIIERVGGLSAMLSPAAALYDLTLRASEIGAPAHLGELVYQRRLPPPASPSGEWNEVVKSAIARRGVAASCEPGAAGPTSVAVRRALASRPTVAIVIPFRNRVDLLRRCVGSIRERASYDRYQILAVDNASDDPETLAYLRTLDGDERARVLSWPERFNFAALNNFAATQTDAEMLLLLNNDTEVVSADFIEALLEHALQPDVGMVGARLTYPDGRLQHAGVVVGLKGLAGHPFDGWPDGGAGASEAAGHGGEVLAAREVSAVTAACAMIRRKLYLEVGGMDTVRFAVSFNDVDLCLRLRAAGYRNVYTPHCQVIHHTSASRGAESNLAEDEQLRARWGRELDGDPYYNRNLSLRVAYRPRFCDRIW